MRVLWIVADVLDPFVRFVEGKPSRGGSWIAPLFYGLAKSDTIKLGVLTPVLEGKNQSKDIDGIKYYAIPNKTPQMADRLNGETVIDYLEAINDFNPDLIHVHGIERNFGQIRKFVDKKVPIVCSIQGIINAYLPYLQASISDIPIKKTRSLKNRFIRGGVEENLRKWNDYISIESEIVKENRYFIGRTIWDKSQIRKMNPDAYYFHGEELLREEFQSKEWNVDTCNRHEVFVSSAAYPIKGFHVALKAIALLKEKYPNIKLVTPLSSLNMKSSKLWDFLFAEDYARYLKKQIIDLGLQDNIKMLKRLSAEEMADCFKNANVFVLSSFVENSPNSLGEAMLVGTPTVVAPVGGVMSIVSDNDSTLIFPSGDHAYLAYQIDKIFSDDCLANSLSNSGKNIAKKRHDVICGVEQYINIYNEIIELHNENTSFVS